MTSRMVESTRPAGRSPTGEYGTHSPGVGALVTLEEPLVVAGRFQRHGPRWGAHREHTDLGALEVVLDDDRAGLDPVVDPRGGIGAGLGDEDALPAGEAVGLDDIGAIAPVEVALGRLWVVEVLRSAGGDAGAGHDVLGKRLGRLQPGGGTCRAEHGYPETLQRIRHPGGQWRLGADHDQVDTVDPRHGGDGPDLGDADALHHRAELGEPGIPRQRDQLLHPGRLGQLPPDGMLPAT